MAITYILAFIALAIILYNSYIKFRVYKSKVSFQSSIDIIELPIITAYTKYGKLNFLLDTGSSDCIISSRVVKNRNILDVDSTVNLNCVSAAGTLDVEGIITLNISIRERQFKTSFVVLNMDTALDHIKVSEGATIHGILGVNFFEKNKYILDFKDNSFYIK